MIEWSYPLSLVDDVDASLHNVIHYLDELKREDTSNLTNVERLDDIREKINSILEELQAVGMKDKKE